MVVAAGLLVKEEERLRRMGQKKMASPADHPLGLCVVALRSDGHGDAEDGELQPQLGVEEGVGPRVGHLATAHEVHLQGGLVSLVELRFPIS